MRIKIKSILVISMLTLSMLIVGWNFNLSAKTEDNEQEMIVGLNLNPLGNRDFNWAEIKAISEPAKGLNYNLGDSEYAKVAVEGSKIYVVWEDSNNTNDAGTDYDIFYRYYDGCEWSKIQVISEPVFGENNNIVDSRKPDIAVENGNIYVVWYDYNNTIGAGDQDSDIFYRSNLSSNGWNDIQVISEPFPGFNSNTGESHWPSIAVENGRIYVVWHDYTNTNNAGSDTDIFYRSKNPSFGWEGIQIISEPVLGSDTNIAESNRPTIAVENSKIHVVWHDNTSVNSAGTDYDIFYRCNLPGSGWEAIQVISEPTVGKDSNNGDSFWPSIAVENSKIYVVWQDNYDINNAGSDYDILYRCNLPSSGWEDIQVISEPILDNGFNTGVSSKPSIAVENSKIYVTWQDNNKTNSAGTDIDIFYRYNLPSSGWEDIQVISEPIEGNSINFDESWGADIEVELNRSHIVWGDITNIHGTGPDADIFYRGSPAILFLNSPSLTPTSGNTSTEFKFSVAYNHKNNKAPQEITLNLNSMYYPMLEFDPSDKNYMDGKTYLYTTTMDIGEKHTYRFMASDGIYTGITRLVNKPDVYNTPPNIITENNVTAVEDNYYEVDYEYEDIDIVNVGQFGNWEFSTDADWLTFNTTTAKLNGTPMNYNVGKHWVNITINDTIDIDYTNFTLIVKNINDPPVIITDDVTTAAEDELYEVEYKVEDMDNTPDELIWSYTTNAEWLAFNATNAILFGIPNNENVGEYWINITVNDTIDIDFTNFTLTVTNVNDPPRISTEDILTIRSNKLYEVDYDAIDIDSSLSNLTWSLITNSSWLIISPTTGLLSGTPTISDLGWYNVNVSVNDGDGGLDWHEFILTVALNTPPIITTIDVVSTKANKLFFIDYEAIDDLTPPDQLLWTLVTNASWLGIETDTGILQGTPTLSDVGWFSVTVSVIDHENAFTSNEFILTVYSIPNKPPEIITKDKLTTAVNISYSVDYDATDDRTPVKYLQWSVETNATWLSIHPTTGVLTGTPILTDVGWYHVHVTVFDGENGLDYHDFILSVTSKPIEENNGPVLTNPRMTPIEGDTETEFTFSVHYYDADGNTPESIQVVIDGRPYDMNLKLGEFSVNGIYTFSTKLSEGNHTFYFTTVNVLDTARTDGFNTPHIKKVDEKSSQEELLSWEFLIFIVILVIIIIIIMIDILIRVKKKPEEKPKKMFKEKAKEKSEKISKKTSDEKAKEKPEDEGKKQIHQPKKPP